MDFVPPTNDPFSGPILTWCIKHDVVVTTHRADLPHKRSLLFCHLSMVLVCKAFDRFDWDIGIS